MKDRLTSIKKKKKDRRGNWEESRQRESFRRSQETGQTQHEVNRRRRAGCEWS